MKVVRKLAKHQQVLWSSKLVSDCVILWWKTLILWCWLEFITSSLNRILKSVCARILISGFKPILISGFARILKSGQRVKLEKKRQRVVAFEKGVVIIVPPNSMTVFMLNCYQSCHHKKKYMKNNLMLLIKK